MDGMSHNATQDRWKVNSATSKAEVQIEQYPRVYFHIF